MHQLTIIIPVFNEEENLERVEQELSAFLKTAAVKTAVLFVDDGSSDSSLLQIRAMCSRHPDFNYIALKKNCGLSAALKAGFDFVETPLTGYMDSDLQTSPQDFNKLLEFSDSYDLVTGLRSARQDGFSKRIASRMANSIRRAFTKDGMSDTGCPLKIIRTEFAKKIPMFKGLHRFLPAMILLQNGKIKQVPVRHFPRTAGKTKFGIANRLLGPLSDCFAYLWMKRKYISYEIKEKG